MFFCQIQICITTLFFKIKTYIIIHLEDNFVYFYGQKLFLRYLYLEPTYEKKCQVYLFLTHPALKINDLHVFLNAFQVFSTFI